MDWTFFLFGVLIRVRTVPLSSFVELAFHLAALFAVAGNALTRELVIERSFEAHCSELPQ